MTPDGKLLSPKSYAKYVLQNAMKKVVRENRAAKKPEINAKVWPLQTNI